MDKVRIIRILEYEGPKKSIEATFNNNAVKGIQTWGVITVREAIINAFPVALEKSEPYVEPRPNGWFAVVLPGGEFVRRDDGIIAEFANIGMANSFIFGMSYNKGKENG